MRTTSGRRASSAEIEGIATARRRPVGGAKSGVGWMVNWAGRTVYEGFGKGVYSRLLLIGWIVENCWCSLLKVIIQLWGHGRGCQMLAVVHSRIGIPNDSRARQ